MTWTRTFPLMRRPGAARLAKGGRVAKGKGLGFPLGLCAGIIFGALIDNMAAGILLGLALGFGIVRLPGGQT